MQASLVILDIMMPKLDGIYACSRIRGLPGYVHTPIVILTLHDTNRSRETASRAGATMFVVKPFVTAALMLALSRFLRVDAPALQTVRDDAARDDQDPGFTL